MFKVSFSGRVGRMNFFIGLLVSVVLLTILKSLVDEFPGVLAIIFGIVTMVAAIWVVVFAISLYIRRLHDVGWSGWWTLLTLVPLVNLVLFLILLFMPGKKENSTYGAETIESATPVGTATPPMMQ